MRARSRDGDCAKRIVRSGDKQTQAVTVAMNTLSYDRVNNVVDMSLPQRADTERLIAALKPYKDFEDSARELEKLQRELRRIRSGR